MSHFYIPQESELRHTLGVKTHKIGKDTRRQMVKLLYEKSKLSHGMEDGTRQLYVGHPSLLGHTAVQFKMKDKNAGGLDRADLNRLSTEFFGKKHATETMMTKQAMARNLSKKISGITPHQAQRLVETLINEIHGHDGHERATRQKKTPSFRRARPEPRRAAAPDKTDPRVAKDLRGGIPSHTGGEPSRGDANYVLRDLHLKF